MASLRFTSLVFVLVYILHESAADIHQVTKKMDVAGRHGLKIVKRTSPSTVEKDIVDAVPTPQEAAANHLIKLGGRKMMKRRFLMKQMAAAKDSMITSTAATTDSNSSVKCVKGKKKLSTMKVNNNNDEQHVNKDDLSSFVTLNADYHPPKSHPPKNN